MEKLSKAEFDKALFNSDAFTYVIALEIVARSDGNYENVNPSAFNSSDINLPSSRVASTATDEISQVVNCFPLEKNTFLSQFD